MMRRILFVIYSILALSCASLLPAQSASEPVYIPLMIKVKGTGTGASASITATLSANPQPPAAIGYVNPSNGKIDFKAQIIPIELGREGELTISGFNASASSFTLTPPPGYTILIDGISRKTKSVSGSGKFNVRVLPGMDSVVAPAGTATELVAGQVKWGVSLGSEKNGQSMGWIWLIGAGTGDWRPYFTPGALYFEQDTDEIAVTKITTDKIKRQIRVNEAIVDIISQGMTNLEANVPAVQGDAKLELRFYHPTQMTTSGSPRTPLANQQPFVVYRICDTTDNGNLTIDTAAKGMRIEKQICSLEPSSNRLVLRTEHTTLTRSSGNDTTYTWNATGWTLAGQTAVADTQATWSTLTGGHREVWTTRDLTQAGSPSVFRVSCDNVSPVASLPRLQVATLTGNLTDSSSVASSTTYFADMMSDNITPDTTKRYRFGFPKLTTATGGAWSTMTYLDPESRSDISTDDKDKWLGVVEYSFSPYLNRELPSTLPTSIADAPADVLVTKYNYEKDAFDYPSRLTLKEIFKNNHSIEKSESYIEAVSAGGRNALLVNQYDSRIYDTKLKSTRTYIREDFPQSFWRSQTFQETSPTGAKTCYLRERGSITSTFGDNSDPLIFASGNSGDYSRIAVINGSATMSVPDTEDTPKTSFWGGTISEIYLLPGRSTATFTYRDAYARVIRTESLLRNFNYTWDLISWENYYYNNRNQLVKKTDPSGTVHELFYNFAADPSDPSKITYSETGPSGEYLTREIDSAGVDTRYTYDRAGRLVKSVRKSIALPGESSRADIVTESVYDAADRVVEQRTYAADNPSFATISTTTYDSAGRVSTQKSSGSPQINTEYNPAARTTTVTNQVTTKTEITETYIDGRPKRISGTGVIEKNFTYSVDDYGNRRDGVFIGGNGLIRESYTESDWLGRTTFVETPAPPGVTGPIRYETTYSNVTGLPLSNTNPGTAPTLTTYDCVGAPVLTGLDADRSGALEPASAKDRISGKRSSAAYIDGAWWATTESYTYTTAGSAKETIVGKSRTRLNGFTGNLVAESLSWDTEGNLTRSITERIRSSRTVITTTWLPGVANPQVSTSVDGLSVSSVSPDGLTVTQTYDSLRRPKKSISPKPGVPGEFREVTTDYLVDSGQPTSLVASVKDPEERVTSYTYDTSFRLQTTTNPDLKTVSQLYDDFGRVTHIYGTATNPVRYVYDALGQRTEQYTYRTDAASGFTDKTNFPVVGSPDTDVVKWDYDSATGLLLQKTDPIGRFVKYQYDAAGRIAKRLWARHRLPGNTTVPATDADRLTATPTYDPDTGDLTQTAYNDDAIPGIPLTPTVKTSYDRLGRPLTITDATGTRAFLRDDDKPWRTLAEVLPAHYGPNRTLSWLYEEQSGVLDGHGYVRGRSRGYQLGTLSQPAALLSQTTLWGTDGRLQSVIGARDNETTSRWFNYTYTPYSRLVQSLSAPGAGFTLTREWDPMRDLLTKIETKSGTRTFASYAYTYTGLGQRRTATQSGEAFGAEPSDPALTTTTYAYDDRGEVTSALTGVGTAAPAENTYAPIPGRQFAFKYDLAGNRIKSTHQGNLNASGASTYEVGRGNQLLRRDNPAASVSGVVSTAATKVTVDTTVLTPADRQGRYWQKDVTPPEGSKLPDEPTETAAGRLIEALVEAANGQPSIPSTTTEYPRKGRQYTSVGSIAGGGVGGTDLAAFDRFDVWLSPRDEQLRYDRDGNLLRDGTWAYTWDAENRLIRQENHAWLLGRTRYKLEFTYDYQGRRATKKVSSWPAGAAGYSAAVETRFLYDGWNLIAEFAVDSATSAVNLAKSYTWGLDLVGSLTASGGVGALLQITDHAEGQSYLPGYDGNGNVAVLVRASDGFRAAAYEYGAFGEVLRAEGLYAFKNAFRFSTKFTDLESGLVYYGMRYYDARNGRFINRDPIEERGGLNLYGFCGNDGVNRYDLLGMSWLSKTWKKMTKWMAKNQWAGLVIGAVLGIVTGGIVAQYALSSIMNVTMQAAGRILSYGITSAATAAATAIGGAVGGFVAGATSTALLGGGIGQSLTAGAWGALGGAAAAGVGSAFGHSLGSFGHEALRAGAHGLAQGGIAELRGGQFGAGFASGLFSSFAGSGLRYSGAPGYIGVPAGGVIGGFGSRLGGGRFVDGFASGLAVNAYNHWGDDIMNWLHRFVATVGGQRLDDSLELAKYGLGAIPRRIDAAVYQAGGGALEAQAFKLALMGGMGQMNIAATGSVISDAGAISLYEGEGVIAIIQNGRIVNQASVMMGHPTLVERTYGVGAALPADAEVVTILKSNGEIYTLTSRSIYGKSVPASSAAQAVARSVYQ